MIKEKLKWVHQKLISHPELRDSNERLYYLFLKEKGYNMNNDVKTFLKDMADRKIPYLDSIARASRKIQEEVPELRGQYWKKRQGKEIEVRTEIKSIK